MRWSEEQLADHLRRRGMPGSPPAVDTSAPPFLPPANAAGAFARGTPEKRDMNKTEAAYERYLWALRQSGEILWYEFESVKLRLADNTFYTPDFAVLTCDCMFEIHETKGFWRDDARVKIKVAASLFPFKFIAISKAKGGGWEREEFS